MIKFIKKEIDTDNFFDIIVFNLRGILWKREILY